jgi:hypothetical protein
MLTSCALVLAVGLVNHRDYGISWDEPISRTNGLVTLKHLARVIAPAWVEHDAVLAELPALEDYRDRDYGVAFELPVAMLERGLGLEDSREIFFLRHLLTFLVCSTALIAVFRMAERRFADFRVALLGAAFLSLSPRLFAESFYNDKDAVFMALFAVAMNASLGFALAPGVKTAVFAALATALAIDVRIMGVVLLPMTLGVVLLRGAQRKIAPRLAARSTGLYLTLTVVAVIACWPYLWPAPLGRFLEAWASMSKFRWDGAVLYFGKVYPASKLPWHYTLGWIAVTTPLLYLLSFFFGASVTLWRGISNVRSLSFSDAELEDLFYLGLFAGPILVTIVLRSVLYDGWRQTYFVYPAFLLLSLKGWVLLARGLRRWRGRRGDLALGLATVASLVSVAGWMRRAHPFESVYFNALVGGPRAQRFDVDYWGVGNRRALEFLAAHDPGAELVLWQASSTALDNSLLLLPSAERPRFTLADSERPPRNARYAFTNFRYESPLLQEIGAKKVLYQTIVDGQPIHTVYELPPPPKRRRHVRRSPPARLTRPEPSE